MTQNKELVTLRRRPMKNGGTALQLDYTVAGVRYRESLKMYLVPERTKIDKVQNQETLKQALAIKAKKVLEIQSGKIGAPVRSGDKIMLLDYMEQRRQVYEKRDSSYVTTMLNAMNHIKAYRGKVSLSQVNKEYILGYIDYLRGSKLSPGTQYLYFNSLAIILNAAVREELIPENPMRRIDPKVKPKQVEGEREFLTLQEVRMLCKAPCKAEQMKEAFLFSCFTGLRISDIKTLRWEDITEVAGRLQIQKRQQKTRELVYIPLSENARAWMPQKGDSPMVFPWVAEKSSTQLKRQLAAWLKGVDLRKHITFHSARHTNATLMLTYGTDLYTVSQLLGHKNIRTTQIYAKVIDRKKQEAVDSIPDIGEI